ncbi:MAG: DNA primase [bacterium]|nr:DNA primase [bacterium]
MASEDILNEIRARCNIVDIASNYVSLKRAGKNWVGRCPFHEERTPSFTVSQEKQLFHCFGCGEGGDLFSFLMKIEKRTFPETVKLLADSLNISLDVEGDKYSLLYKLNERATRFYSQMLFEKNGEKALSYLLERGINREAIEEFRLGYAPSGFDLLKNHLRKDSSEKEQLTAGLIRQGTKGMFDWVQNRLIFPIADRYGKIIGFGARALDENMPKYINTKETLIYNKSRVLYGLDKATDAIREKKEVILVEGYVDVIMSHQYGFKNVLATCGTALTESHISLIRGADSLVLCFDQDQAGRSATEKSIGLLMKQGKNIDVLLFQKAKDPAELLKNEGEDGFKKAYLEKQEFLEFSLSIASSKNKKDGFNYLLPIIKQIEEPIRRQAFIKDISERLNIDEGIIISSIKGMGPSVSEVIKDRERGILSAEKHLLKLMLEDEEICLWATKEIEPTIFLDPVGMEVFLAMKERLSEEVFSADKLARVVSEPARKLISALLAEATPEGDRYKDAEGYIKTMKERLLKDEIKSLHKEIKEREKRGEDVSSLLSSYQQLAMEVKR